MASLLHASMCGDHGEEVLRYVSVPRVRNIRITVNTAAGRRRGLFSPVPVRKGSANRRTITSTGMVRSSTVSI